MQHVIEHKYNKNKERKWTEKKSPGSSQMHKNVNLLT